MSIVSVPQAIQQLQQGAVVAIPTETVYGLAARYDREDSLRQIFAIKQRPFFDPLIVHVENVAQAQPLVAEWPAIFHDLARAFWPGPLTLIARKTDLVSPLITSGLETVAIRCPDHAMALAILKETGPLAAPSANRFGRTSPTCAQHVASEFDVPIVDGGDCRVGVESTVISADVADGKWALKILRPGGISRRQLQEALSKTHQVEISRAHSVASPGHLKAHYQPTNPVVIVKSGARDVKARITKSLPPATNAIFWFTLPDSPEQAARQLYAEFRRLSQRPGIIAIERGPEHQLNDDWDAIWDRIERASTLTLE